MSPPTLFDRLRSAISDDLKTALKSRDRVATGALRAALNALDNATAVPLPSIGRLLHSGEVARRLPVPAEMEKVLIAEAQERAAAALAYRRLGQAERADILSAEARIIRGCLAHLPHEPRGAP